MRFYLGFSKRISLKWILTIIGGLLVFFGIYINAHADSFTTPQNWSTCTFGTTQYNSSACTVYGSTVYNTQSLNSLTNVLVPNGAYTQNGNLRQNKMKTEIYKYGGTSDCSTGSQISLYVDAVMGGYNGSFADNVLDYTQFGGISTRSTKKSTELRATCPNSWCDYWPWLSNNQADSQNKTGVKISKSDGTAIQNCIFVSYGSNKSVRFLCNVASGTSGYQIILNEYNNGYTANTNLMSSVGIKTTILNDPCRSYSNDQSGVIDAIGDQSSGIIDGINGIIDNQNQNAEQNHQDLNDIKDKLDGINDNITDSTVDSSSTSDYLSDGFQDHHGVGAILTAPIRLYQALIDYSDDYGDGIGEEDDDIPTGTTRDGGGSGGGASFSCNGLPINLSLLGATNNFEIPCGAIFWNQVPQSFINLWNMVVWGFMGYTVLKMSAKMIHRILDPDYRHDFDDLSASKEL